MNAHVAANATGMHKSITLLGEASVKPIPTATPPMLSAVSITIDKPIGSITTAVAVLDTHMDKKPVACSM